TYHSAVMLGGSDTLKTTANGAIGFASTVDATTAGVQGLTVNAGTGTVTFAAAVGGSQALASLTVTGPTTLDAGVSTDGGQTYNSAVTLANTLTLNSNADTTANGAIDFASTVDAASEGIQGLTVTAGAGAVTFEGAVGGKMALASLTATGGTITLDANATVTGALVADSTGPGSILAINTTLSATTVSLTAPAISISGAVAGTTSVSLIATGGGITGAGSVTTPLLTGSATATVNLTGTNNIAALGASAASPFSDGGNAFTLMDAGAASLAVNGVSAATVSLTALAISIPGAITGTTSVGLIATGGGITESGSVTSALLTGSAATSASLTGSNAVLTLGNFTATTGFALTDMPDLSVTGTVSGGSAATITDTGTLGIAGSVAGTTVNLTGAGIGITGAVSGPTSVTLTARSAGITETGTLIAGTLTGSSAGATTLAGATATANQIADLSNFKATSLTLLDGESLTVLGPVIASSGAVAVTTQGVLTNNSTIQASTNATLRAGTGLTNTGSVIAQTGNASLTASTGTLSNSGLISAAASAAVVALTANGGPIIQTGNSAAIIAGGQVVMDATGGITLSGLVQDATGVVLNSGGAIYQNGSLIADLLTGSAAGTVDLAGATSTANQVANLGNFTAGGSFVLNDGANLLISGVVSAATINIDDGTNTISLGNAGFVTGGAVRPPIALLAAQLPPSSITTQGAYLHAGNVIQTGGSFTVANLPGTPESILSISLPPNGGGTLQFNSAGLIAPATWLIVSVGNGQASGPIDVAALDFAYSPPPGRASLAGSIGGFNGQAAAAAAFIQPQPNANFRVNGCPIHSVNCVLLATQGVPQTNPANDIVLGVPFNQNPEDLVVPAVSDERYELVPCDDPNAKEGCPADIRRKH
ncbi:MAG TPA: hypothetical protein VND19_03305, partial [Acetobacteraceae bacterium]|nr:hypothetical protein [Acetobacteraceae bacterium]